MRISRYDILAQVVTLGSFSAAANALGYTPSALNQAVTSLEDELGVKLLERSRKGVRLSSDGALLLPDVLAIRDAEGGLRDRVLAIREVLVGTVAIGTFTSASCHILPQAIARFQQRHSRVTFQLMHGTYYDIEGWLRSGQVQLGFLRTPAPAALETLPLPRDQLMAVLPPDHPLASLERVPVERLSQERFILVDEGPENEYASVFTAHGLRPNTAYEMADDYAALAFVEQGLGVTILPGRVLARHPYHVALRELEPPVHRDIVLACRSREQLSPAARAFWDEMVQL